MPAYFVAEITRIILSVYMERRNVTPGERPGSQGLGNRKQMLSSPLFSHPPPASTLFLSAPPSQQHSPHFRSTQGKWAIGE